MAFFDEAPVAQIDASLGSDRGELFAGSSTVFVIEGATHKVGR